MVASLARPELLNIVDESTREPFFGGIQDWYSTEWRRKAGCGPTCAANLMAYLALTRPELRPLYNQADMHRASFARHMEEIYRFVTPGPMGLNKVEMFYNGVSAFAHSRGISLRPHVFRVSSNRLWGREDPIALADFVKAGLASDCPIAFLNLSQGKEKNLQGWHWITITKAIQESDRLLTEASDEGFLRRFDLRLWYLTTRMSGGLIYFTV